MFFWNAGLIGKLDRSGREEGNLGVVGHAQRWLHAAGNLAAGAHAASAHATRNANVNLNPFASDQEQTSADQREGESEA